MSVESIQPTLHPHPDEAPEYPEEFLGQDDSPNPTATYGEAIVQRAEDIELLAIHIRNNQPSLNLANMPVNHPSEASITYRYGKTPQEIGNAARERASQHRIKALGICAACPLSQECAMQGSLITLLNRKTTRDAITTGLSVDPTARCDELIK